MEHILTSKINGAFNGFNSNKLFKLANRTYWIQLRYKYWYHYEYRPTVEIYKDGGRYFLKLQNRTESVEVRRISNVIEDRINGEFKGWDGKSEYTLMNGMKFRQAVYNYEYQYAYSPDVIIYETSNGLTMDVDGCAAIVRRI